MKANFVFLDTCYNYVTNFVSATFLSFNSDTVRTIKCVHLNEVSVLTSAIYIFALIL